MNIPGTSMEQPPAGQELDPNAPPVDHEDDGDLVETVKVGDTKMVPVAELIRVRKESKAARKELESLRPQIERAQAIGQQLQELQPTLDMINRMTPQQREALATGRAPSPAGTQQPADDVEARELAEDMGLIALDGSLDIARARKRLDKDNVRFQRMLQEAVAPIRHTGAQQAATALRAQAAEVRDKDGVPLATRESIDEAYQMLPAELAAQPNVAMVALGTAMLIDRMRGRTAKQPEPTYGAPLYSEPVTGRRGVGLTAEDRAIAAKVGLTDKEMTDAATKIQSSGRGVRLE